MEYCTDNLQETASPVYTVQAVPIEQIEANSCNASIIAPSEMELLELSIWEDGYTMPCVCCHRAENNCYELVDGFHRYMVMKTSRRIYEREQGCLPVCIISKDASGRIASAIRHNRARGTHAVQLLTSLVITLKMENRSDAWIMKNFGMNRDELLRFKQIPSLAAMFAGNDFSIP